jgi:uroporphyrinogen-III synthase
MMPLIVIRPEPGCSATLAAAQKMGLATQGFPLFRIAAKDWQAPAAKAFDALLLGSANALRHGGAGLKLYAGKPAYVVGEATALAAREAGLVVVSSGSGGLQEVLDKAAHPRLLRLAGDEHVALEPPPGITLAERITYVSLPQPMPAALAEMLVRPAVVMLHSAAAARHFAGECGRLGIERNNLILAVISPRTAEAAGPGWGRIATAAQPSDHALLALAGHLCQTAAS